MHDDPAEQAAQPLDEAERDALVSLERKYEHMLVLRDTLGRGLPSKADRARLRALAAEFPGALRELETLTTPELADRLKLSQAAARGETVPAWLLWTALYHALMHRALGARREQAGTGSPARLPHGRLNVVIFAALAARFEIDAHLVWGRLFPATGRAERPYRAASLTRG